MKIVREFSLWICLYSYSREILNSGIYLLLWYADINADPRARLLYSELSTSWTDCEVDNCRYLQKNETRPLLIHSIALFLASLHRASEILLTGVRAGKVSLSTCHPFFALQEFPIISLILFSLAAACPICHSRPSVSATTFSAAGRFNQRMKNPSTVRCQAGFSVYFLAVWIVSRILMR